MKLGIFTDSHYCNAEILCTTRRPSLSLQKIREAMDAFQREKVELVLCLGDLIDVGESSEHSGMCMKEAIALIQSYQIPYRVIPGNHDYTVLSATEFSEMTGCSIPPYTVETETHRLIFLDANYRSDYRRFDVAGVEWKDSNLPPWQIDYLKNALKNTDRPCVVCLHECIDSAADENHRVKNAEVIRCVLEESGNVPLVLQGHYHKGADYTENKIRYLTVPAMCEGVDNQYCILEQSF